MTVPILPDPFTRLPAEVMHCIREFHSPHGRYGYRDKEHVLLAISRYWFRIVMVAKWRHLEAPVNRVLGHIETYRTFPWLQQSVMSLTVGGSYPLGNFSGHIWAHLGSTMVDPDVRLVPSLGDRVFMDLRRIMRVPFNRCTSHIEEPEEDKEVWKANRAQAREEGDSPRECEMCQRIDEPNWPFPEPQDFYDDDAFTVADLICSDPFVFSNLDGPYGRGAVPGISSFNDYWREAGVLIDLVKPKHLRLADRASPVPKPLASTITDLHCVKHLEIQDVYPYFCIPGKQSSHAPRCERNRLMSGSLRSLPAYYTKMVANVEELSMRLDWNCDEMIYFWVSDPKHRDEEKSTTQSCQSEGEVKGDRACFLNDDDDEKHEDDFSEKRKGWSSMSLGFIATATDSLGRKMLARSTWSGFERFIDDAPANSLSGRLLDLIESATQLRRLTLHGDGTCVALLSARLLPVYATLDSVDTFMTKPGIAQGNIAELRNDVDAHLAHTIPLSSLRDAFLALVHDSDPPRALRESDVHDVADQPEFWVLSKNLHRMASAIVQKFNEREKLPADGHR
ncbi:hypothetical protein IE81DRAFT_87818 [Ceraceosorus guamensis]|uniref:Uncharacterized protein n=1 Tax=Ceraceosorus guamensis TaxID=1522189 RepID=A0A316W0N1_9BASI|nr:hypothetical protein IE81DRAFT_87818 [Ceraceosorus guamensis]PWN43350.1 hypothetical protein IE81DRAFT_87818 [Ceraceosorus guamensis]